MSESDKKEPKKTKKRTPKGERYLTEPRPMDSTVTRCPSPWSTDTCWSAFMLESEGLGTARTPSAHCGRSQILQSVVYEALSY